MVDIHHHLVASYHSLQQLYARQIELAEKPRYDEQIDEVYALENSKRELQLVIQEQRLNTFDYETIPSETKEVLLRLITSTQQMNDRLQAMIGQWYKEDSRSMKQVNVQRKTLHSYGGINSNEVISYYIDSKK